MTSQSPVRRTRQQLAIREALAGRSDFVAAQQLHASMVSGGHKVGLATVYRALQSFDEAGEVDSIVTEAGETLYRACETPRHHHHLVCRECGRTEEIDGPEVEAWTARVAADHGFSEVEHTAEIFGRCLDCAA
ncbi:zinc uptake regulator, Fur family [Kytococcus aerolatus]|uniref:Zinc uptake regulator, Fur family n=1 Tax=Kytococcus aerolatus TaxID=592308 RepID=A0A212U2N1_9MICO|nr:Fur family transcriptional regulator [Kytococcus aerolatus]SNC72410.1 zinc uptake regulator, Fur family [Kytococcus aerolatus]